MHGRVITGTVFEETIKTPTVELDFIKVTTLRKRKSNTDVFLCICRN